MTNSHKPKQDRAELEALQSLAERRTKEEAEANDRNRNFRLSQFTTGLLAFTLLAAGWQACESRRSVNASREAVMLNQRAWLTVRKATVRGGFKLGEKPTVDLEVVNTGLSPALETVVYTYGRLDADLPKFDVFPFAEVKEAALAANPTRYDKYSHSVIGPGTSPLAPSPFEKPEQTFTADVAADLTAGTRSYFAYGYIEYVDIFKQSHVTTFCFRNDNTNAAMASCWKWNTAQ